MYEFRYLYFLAYSSYINFVFNCNMEKGPKTVNFGDFPKGGSFVNTYFSRLVKICLMEERINICFNLPNVLIRKNW